MTMYSDRIRISTNEPMAPMVAPAIACAWPKTALAMDPRLVCSELKTPTRLIPKRLRKESCCQDRRVDSTWLAVAGNVRLTSRTCSVMAVTKPKSSAPTATSATR